MNFRLPAEWEPQDGVLLAWPHGNSDWGPVLDRVIPVFIEIACQVSRVEKVLIAVPQPDTVLSMLKVAGADLSRVIVAAVETNDTWSRDFGPLTVYTDSGPLLLDFGFNGWGLKFPSDLDNQVTRKLARGGHFGATPLRTLGLILEGGSIESDGRGTLLTTSECLLNPNRNPHLQKAEIERKLARLLGADHFLWLDHGYLAGDDTDSHIDTLARLGPDDTILYVRCGDADDEHFAPLQRMEKQLREFRTRAGAPFRLLPLPWPQPHFDEQGERLPATYANFLVVNDAVLVPTYNDPRDGQALAAIGEAFPGRAIIGIDCSALVLQHGSLHCVTMQIPQGVLG